MKITVSVNMPVTFVLEVEKDGEDEYLIKSADMSPLGYSVREIEDQFDDDVLEEIHTKLFG